MAKGSKLTLDALAALHPEKLARIMMREAEKNKPFSKRLEAAVAAAKGPKAIASWIDARLGALEKARGKISWSKAKAFESDVAMTVTVIEEELGPATPIDAMTRLFRLLSLAPILDYRIGRNEEWETEGLLDDAYGAVHEAIGRLCLAIPENDRGSLVPLMASLATGAEAHLAACTENLAPLLQQEALRDLDVRLEEAHQKAGKGAGERVRSNSFIAARQAVAEARNDVDALIALELLKESPDNLALAEKLLAAGRPQDALTWIRKPKKQTIRYATRESIADGSGFGDIGDFVRTPLEARILEALGDKTFAQNLRWTFFETTLHPEALRAYIGKLGDFEEFDAMDRAFSLVRETPDKYRALSFLMAWPRLDEAAGLVMKHCAAWDGAHYEILTPAAEALKENFPVAATVLYRIMLDHILNRSNSRAYHHAAVFYIVLEGLAPRLSHEPALTIENPASYRIRLEQKHGRKAGFWQLVQDHIGDMRDAASGSTRIAMA